jgi:hypothetical protein
MGTITIADVIGQLPASEVATSMNAFLSPLIDAMPDRRLGRVVPLAVQGILGSESPVVLQMAQTVSRVESEVWPAAKRIYGLLKNPRTDSEQMSSALYKISAANIAQDKLERLVVAIDPVNFEKPYTEKLEGVSTVHKSTPPDRNGQARLTSGYPSITATVVNTRIPATTYANWFSYTTNFLHHQLRE